MPCLKEASWAKTGNFMTSVTMDNGRDSIYNTDSGSSWTEKEAL